MRERNELNIPRISDRVPWAQAEDWLKTVVEGRRPGKKPLVRVFADGTAQITLRDEITKADLLS